MRVWVDLTNSPHVLVMRPVIRVLEQRGAEVLVTARDFAQTLELCERHGLACEAIGRHRGGRLAAKGVGLLSRSAALARWARGRRIDVALGHGSNDVTVAARLLGIPSATAFDYEWAKVQHNVNCRLVRAIVVPDAIPLERLRPYGATAAKYRPYAGLKEEYYLADFEPDPAVLDELGLDPASRSRSCARRPRCRSTTGSRTRSSPRARPRAGDADRRPPAYAREQRAELDGFIVPERAIDAQSLVAYADLVISAGGTMNREAVALGTPVWTTFEGGWARSTRS